MKPRAFSHDDVGRTSLRLGNPERFATFLASPNRGHRLLPSMARGRAEAPYESFLRIASRTALASAAPPASFIASPTRRPAAAIFPPHII